MAVGILKKIKSLIIRPGERKIKIKGGLANEMYMNLDPAKHSQRIWGLYEKEIEGIVRQYACSAEIIIDVGANDGYYTVAFAGINPNAEIFFCEPEYKLVERCLGNLSMNGTNKDNKIHAISKFIGTLDDEKFLAIDNLLDRPVSEPIFIKMDIDGGELDALKSGESLLKQQNCFLVVETHSPQLETDCIKFLSGLGYTCKVIDNAWWRAILPELRPLELNRWFSAQKL